MDSGLGWRLFRLYTGYVRNRQHRDEGQGQGKFLIAIIVIFATEFLHLRDTTVIVRKNVNTLQTNKATFLCFIIYKKRIHALFGISYSSQNQTFPAPNKNTHSVADKHFVMCFSPPF